MSDMANRRKVMELAHTGVTHRGMDGAMALIQLPLAVAKVLEEMTDEPVRAYLAMGTAQCAALEAFLAAQPKEPQP